ncbi:MAG: patatin-like phospholipase family protein, partial [Candidatus Gastranaerophilales bacterium]|nr:patatin-like phospholipase family protein [Candidatus Gastranaerophilales bacterium]
YLPFGKAFSFCKGDNLYYWIKEKIEKKVYGSLYHKENQPVTFKDLDTNLIITSTNISSKEAQFYSKNTPDMEIALAIRASTSVPGFFQPVWSEDNCFVDGDIVKNIPLWEVSDLIPKNSRILEFRLEGDKSARIINNPIDYFNAVVDTSANIATDFIIDKYGLNDRYDFIKINTGNVAIIDFSINDDVKKKLVKDGIFYTEKYFKKELVEKKQNLKNIYQKLLAFVKSIEKQVRKNKLKEAKYTLSEMVVYTAENKIFIDENIYKISMDVFKYFVSSGYVTPFLKTQKLNDKNLLLFKIRKTFKTIEKQLKDIDAYLEFFN